MIISAVAANKQDLFCSLHSIMYCPNNYADMLTLAFSISQSAFLLSFDILYNSKSAIRNMNELETMNNHTNWLLIMNVCIVSSSLRLPLHIHYTCTYKLKFKYLFIFANRFDLANVY